MSTAPTPTPTPNPSPNLTPEDRCYLVGHRDEFGLNPLPGTLCVVCKKQMRRADYPENPHCGVFGHVDVNGFFPEDGDECDRCGEIVKKDG